jgi:hypothetical protein
VTSPAGAESGRGGGAELGEYPPVLEVSEAVFDWCVPGGEDLVGYLLAGRGLVDTGG